MSKFSEFAILRLIYIFCDLIYAIVAVNFKDHNQKGLIIAIFFCDRTPARKICKNKVHAKICHNAVCCAVICTLTNTHVREIDKFSSNKFLYSKSLTKIFPRQKKANYGITLIQTNTKHSNKFDFNRR